MAAKDDKREPKMWAGGTPAFDERSGRYKGVRMAVDSALRAKIEAWIKATGRNEFGDPDGTMYAGGTPLFDERTGKTRDRFEHILDKHPEVKDWEGDR